MIDPNEHIITRKRKKYRFALFANSPLCFEYDEWQKNQPIDVLEVGAGTGLFSVSLAEKSPHKRFVAIDVKADRLQKGATLAAEKGLKNISFLRMRADQLEDLFLSSSIEKIWVTFPDPFPRERSAKHRLTYSQFLHSYEQLLRPNGLLCFKTDAMALFDWSLEQLINEKWSFRSLSFDLHSSTLPVEYKTPTTYETRFINEGLKIGFVEAIPPKKA